MTGRLTDFVNIITNPWLVLWIPCAPLHSTPANLAATRSYYSAFTRLPAVWSRLLFIGGLFILEDFQSHLRPLL